MFTRILTATERQRMKAFIKADGEKKTFMTVLATRCRSHVPTIKEDLALIEIFMQVYNLKTHVTKS